VSAHRIGRSPAIALACFALGLSIMFPARVNAQSAWVPVDGEISVSLIFQNLNFAGHFDFRGTKNENVVPSRAYLGIFQVEYALTDRLAVTARLPYIASKFTGREDERVATFLRDQYEEFRRTNPEVASSSLDTGRFYATFQDFNFTFRYNLLDAGLVVTPAIGATIPSHHYRTIGEAAPGQDRRALHIGVNAGRLLDPLLPNAYVHARYTYSFVERLLGVPLDRSSAEFEAGYAVTPTLTVRGLVDWSHTHGGLVLRDTLQDVFLFVSHDRLLASRYWHVGGAATLSLTDSIDLDGGVVTFLSGSSTHYGLGATAGVTWRFLPVRASSPASIPFGPSSSND
jgi:hypothetical protein